MKTKNTINLNWNQKEKPTTKKSRTAIRKGVFETNSSSVHTLVISYDVKYIPELETEGNDVIAHCHDYSDFGNEKDAYLSTQQEKLDYLMSWISCKQEYSYGYGEDISDMWEYGNVLEAIREVIPNVERIVVNENERAQFDHQTAPYSYNDCVVNFDNIEELRNFIFNKHFRLKCYFD